MSDWTWSYHAYQPEQEALREDHERIRIQALAPDRGSVALRVDSEPVSLKAGETLDIRRDPKIRG